MGILQKYSTEYRNRKIETMYACDIEKEETVIQTKIVGSLHLNMVTRDCDESELEKSTEVAICWVRTGQEHVDN